MSPGAATSRPHFPPRRLHHPARTRRNLPMTKASFVLAAILLPVAAPALAAPPEPPMDFAVCRSCHSTEAGRNGVGPPLRGILGSKAGAGPGYVLSPALKIGRASWRGKSWQYV